MSVLPSSRCIRIAMGWASKDEISRERATHAKQSLVASAKAVTAATAGFFVGLVSGPIGLGVLMLPLAFVAAISGSPLPVGGIGFISKDTSFAEMWLGCGVLPGTLFGIALGAHQLEGIDNHLFWVYDPKAAARQEIRDLFVNAASIALALAAFGLLIKYQANQALNRAASRLT